MSGLLSGVRRAHEAWRIIAGLSLSACAVYDEPPIGASASLSTQPSTAVPHAAPSSPDASVPQEITPACVGLTEVDPCDALPRLAAAPKLDGAPECGLTLHALAITSPAAKLSAEPERATPPPAAAYAAAWFDSGFYVYLEVHTAQSTLPAPSEPLYCGDAVEIFVDSDGQPGTNGAYNAPGTMQFVVGAPQGTAMNTARFLAGSSQGPWITSNLSVRDLEDGYAAEALIVGSDLGLWSWQPSTQLGFNLAVNVAGAGEPRGALCTTGVGQSVLRLAAPRVDCDGKPWCDTRSFCWPALGHSGSEDTP